MKTTDRFLASMLGLIAALALFDGVQESDFFYGFIGASLAMIAPATCWGSAFRRRRANKVHAASYAGAIGVAAIGVFAYFGYAVTGVSNPDTAGHMHVVLFPIVYLILSWAVCIPLLLIDMFRNKRPNPGIEPTH